MQKVDVFSNAPVQTPSNPATSYWGYGSYILSTAASYIPGVSRLYSTNNQEPLINESIKSIFLSSIGEDSVTPEWVAEQMSLPIERILEVHNSIAAELAGLKQRENETSIVLSFYHSHMAGDISITGIAINTGISPQRIQEIFNSIG